MKQKYTVIKNFFIAFSFIITFSVLQSFAQAPQIQWAKCYGGSSNDRAEDIHRTSDSGYVVCGFTNSTDGQVTNNHGFSDGWILKLDVNGTLQWQKTFGGSNDDGLNAVRQLPDGGYLACGYTASSDGDVDLNKGADDFWVIRTDQTGNLIWSKTYGGSGDEIANDFASTGDTGFVVVGHTFSTDGDITNYKGGGDGWLVFIDTLGNLLKQKDKGGNSFDEFQSIITAENGGFLLVGSSASNTGTLSNLNHGGTDAWLARLSRFGTDQWNALYGDTLDDGGYDVHENADAQFVVSGFRNNNQTDSWLFTVDSLGVFINENIHGGNGEELPGSSIEKTLSNYIVAGSSNSDPSGDKDCHYAGYDIWLYNTLNGGAITWQKCLGGTSDDISSRAIASPDGSIGICGYTNSTDLDVQGNHGDYDFWVIRLLDGCDVSASFTDSVDNQTVFFTNTSFDGTSFEWSFGDGTFSTDINPVHTYAADGSYSVCLISHSLCAADTFCQTIQVACAAIVSDFTYTVDGTTVTFTSTSTGASSWKWKFGDAGNSTLENPVHTYADTGSYDVCLIIFSSCATDTFCQTIHVTICAQVVAGISHSENALTATFTDLSANATSWSWDFGDGNSSTAQDPVHTYSAPGTYQVCLIASNECSHDTTCVSVTVQCATVTSAFSFITSGLTASFSDLSVGATAWDWTFGDGNTSNTQNPSHTYSGPGTYSVCLSASNGCDTNTLCTQVTIECPPFSAAFAVQQIDNTITLTDQSVNSTSWSWTFGDGGTSIDQNPTHSYTANGIYEVCLVAYDGCSFDSTCDSVVIIGLGTGSVTLPSSTLSIYPNPFTDVATISFTVQTSSAVTLTLTDVQGRLLSTLLDQNLTSGNHSFAISKKNLAAGVYLLQLKQGSETVVKRLIIE